MVGRATVIAAVEPAIARTIAQRRAARGDGVVLLAASPSGQEQPARGIETMACDLADRAAIEAALARIEDRLGPIASVVLGPHAPDRQATLGEVSRAQWTSAVDAPLNTAFHLCQAALVRLAARKAGSLVFVLSDYAIVGLREGAPFAAGQTALYSFAKAIAREFAPLGIRINCVGSGWMPPGTNADSPIGRAARPDDVAAAADFLLSDGAGYITGQLLQPNGGRVMW
jgi:2-hydroxycyclohexanecarboxyl-CoA dehydrogenase